MNEKLKVTVMKEWYILDSGETGVDTALFKDEKRALAELEKDVQFCIEEHGATITDGSLEYGYLELVDNNENEYFFAIETQYVQ